MMRSVTLARAWLLLCVFATGASADDGKPVAVRWWGQGMVSIETYWNLHVVIDPHSASPPFEVPEAAADLVLTTNPQAKQLRATGLEGDPTVVPMFDDRGHVRPINHLLDRLPNQQESAWAPADASTQRSGHAVAITSHDSQQGGRRSVSVIFVIEVDGVRIAYFGGAQPAKLDAEQLRTLGRSDVLLIPVKGTGTGADAAAIVREVQPRVAIPIHFDAAAKTAGMQPVENFASALDEDAEVVRCEHNTLAVSANDAASTPTKVVVLGHRAWQPSGELAELIDAMESSCRRSQQVFAPLSAEQMNFRPPNGTHTPRWNAEHMMGRELGFFSEIYAEIDPAFSAIDLNPAQMPPDYQAAHPDWTGAEEARQMERASRYVRRFAYLLDELDLDEQAPGSRWTLRGLLCQMDRHYSEHTANVKKKFTLPGWPTN